MDPQKSPDASQPPQDNTKTPPASEDTGDISMSGENGVQPGTIVVGGKDEAPAPSPATPEAPPAPPVDDSNMPAFMRDPTATDVPPPPAGGKKKGLIIGIIAGALLLVGGAAAYYFAYMVPNKPENVLKSALVNTFSKDKVTSLSFEGNATVTEKESDTKFSMDFSGGGDQDGKLTFTSSIDATVTNVTVDFRSVDGKTYYAKVGGLAGLPELMAQSGNEVAAMYAPLLSAINDQWYEINQSFIEQITGKSSVTPTLSDADRQKIAKAYEDNPFLSVKETLADEKIAGVDSHHYKVVIDGPKLQAFVSAVEAAKLENTGLTPEMLTSLKDGINGVNFANYPVDVWVAKDSKLFTQFAFSAQNDEVAATLRLTLKDYNKPITVEKPEGAKSILEVLNSFYQAFLGTGITAEDLPISESNGISL